MFLINSFGLHNDDDAAWDFKRVWNNFFCCCCYGRALTYPWELIGTRKKMKKAKEMSCWHKRMQTRRWHKDDSPLSLFNSRYGALWMKGARLRQLHFINPHQPGVLSTYQRPWSLQIFFVLSTFVMRSNKRAFLFSWHHSHHHRRTSSPPPSTTAAPHRCRWTHQKCDTQHFG